MSKLPFMQFYPSDWIQDTQGLTLEAQGAWIKILCALWIAPERGRREFGYKELETFWGRSHTAVEDLIDDLASVADIILCDSAGNMVETHGEAVKITIVSRRMVREENQRKQGLEADRRYREGKTSSKRQKNVGETSPIFQKSEVISKEKSLKRKTQIPLPSDFQPSEKTKAWAKTNYIDPDSELEAFRDHHTAKGSTFKDWEAAFRTWLRNAKRWNSNRPQTQKLAHSTVPDYKPGPREPKPSPEQQQKIKSMLQDLTTKLSMKDHRVHP